MADLETVRYPSSYTNTNTVVALAQAGNWGQSDWQVGARLTDIIIVIKNNNKYISSITDPIFGQLLAYQLAWPQLASPAPTASPAWPQLPAWAKATTVFVFVVSECLSVCARIADLL